MLGFLMGIPQNHARLPARDQLFPFLPRSSRAVRRRRPLSTFPRAIIVPHITLSKKTNCQPSLEFYSETSGEVRRVTIEHFPFRIGRAESADLRVESVEVSREHAEIFERNDMWLVRDLGSTNGTLVNGKPIKETLLSDGDILKIAETELTFVASVASQFQRMVTQPIQSKNNVPAPRALPPEVAAARMMTEATLWQAIPTQVARRDFAAIWHDRGFVCAGYHRLASGPRCSINRTPWASAIERSSGLLTLELASERDDAEPPVPARGRGGDRSAASTVSRISSNCKDGCRPAGNWASRFRCRPTSTSCESPTSIAQAQEHELLVAFDEFQGNGGQVMHLKSLLPDYLVLAANMTNDLISNRQPLRRLESLLTACEELAIKPVLPLGDSGHTVARVPGNRLRPGAAPRRRSSHVAHAAELSLPV